MSEVNLREADKLELTVVIDNYALITLESTEVVKRPQIPPPNALWAEHGLSCLLKVCAGPEEHWVLLDTGISAPCLLHNMDAMGMNLSRVESVVLSHGHFDHFGGLMGFLGRVKRGIPLTVHPDAFLELRLNSPVLKCPVDLPRLDEMALSKAGAEICKTKEATTLASDLVLVTGEVERVTDFEKGFPWMEAKIDGEWVEDLLNHDQGVAVNVKGRGLVVIGGCSHAGIINTVKYTQKLAGVEKVHAVLGGFHLIDSLFETIISPTIEEMKKIGPDFVVPMHCTGWKAINQFAEEMPVQFILNIVGTTYIFQ